ncbi:MAG TPA: cyclic nucleotide-binding domain-containing protein [SAR202 cluster bacterium]|nr:cyclic nucleotide-binding domain-containing protein [SAR202 cluster bacterium]|tara:strand:- start:5773 stop:6912 length:1140 start_codon:yes stop_codon:yes gene_type:complete
MPDNSFDNPGSLDEPILTAKEIEKYREYLSDYGKEIFFSEEETIVDYGDITTSIDLLVSGEALVEVPVNEKWIPVAWIKSGSVIGEIAFLDSYPRTARVIARTSCRLYRVDRADFTQLSERDPEKALEFISRISQIMAYRLRRIEQFDAVEQGRDDMRKELAADLHDQTMSELSAILMHLGLLKLTLDGHAESAADIEHLVTMVKNADVNLRQLVREKGHDDLAIVGLEESLRIFFEGLENEVVPFSIKIAYTSNQIDQGGLPGPVARDLYQIIRQSVLNSVEHANPEMIQVEIIWKQEGISFFVKDNGVGFNQSSIDNVPEAGHFGLLNLKLRTERVGGSVNIISAEGKGTNVIGSIPITRRISEYIEPQTVQYTLSA